MAPDIADAARSILRQYNEIDHWIYRFKGPHFVTYTQGGFKLHPFGAYADDRYSFDVWLEHTLPGQEPLWIFTVRF